MIRKRQMDGEGMQVSSDAHFTSKQQETYTDILIVKQESLINTQDWTLYLHWGDKRVETKN